MKFSRIALVLTAAAALVCAKPHTGFAQPDGTSARSHTAAYESCAKKFQRIDDNAHAATPDRNPTTISADEVNAYVTEGGVNLPAGVEGVKFEFRPAVVISHLRVDFDRLATARNSANPFMHLFTGVHDVDVTSQAQGASGTGSVRVDTVEIDGVKVPRAALEYFVEHYLQPKYGEYASLNPTFKLPLRMDMLVFGTNLATVYQR